MANEHVELSYDEFIRIFRPIPNHLDHNSLFDGTLFGTNASELSFVKGQRRVHIWIFCDGDDGGTCIRNGKSSGNPLGYFVTEEPCLPKTTIHIKVQV